MTATHKPQTRSRNELTELLLGQEIPIRFISMQRAITLHDESIGRAGGLRGVRDAALLDSALHRPMLKALYEGERDPVVLAAVLAEGVVQNHPFLDGNKRTGFLCCVEMLGRNGIEFKPDVADTVDCFLALARGDIGVDDLTQWIRTEIQAQEEMRAHMASMREGEQG